MQNKKITYRKSIRSLILTLLLFTVQISFAQLLIVEKKNVSCPGKKDGLIRAELVGGGGPGITYSWSHDPNLTSLTASGLGPGTYFVTARFENTGCSLTAGAQIKEPAPLKLEVMVERISTGCGRPTLELTPQASGGTPGYIYSPPKKTVSSTCNHPFRVTDSKGCKENTSKFVVIIPVFCSFDPNDIIGPDGVGDEKWVAQKDELPYKIRFENDPDFATGPAQRVTVRQTLDSNINMFSLKLMDFGFGSFSFEVPESNPNFYSTRLDLRDSLGIFVDFTAGLDVSKREVFWIFESIDPATGLPPAQGSVGFLAINDTLLGDGEGFVTYSVKPATNTVTGDTIYAEADIVFDINEPIHTPRIFNTIDAVGPTSALNPLPNEQDSVNIHLSWEGADDPGGSGTLAYNLYVSIDGGQFSLAIEGIEDTAVVFVGETGKRYDFYTRAIDRVTNDEEEKSIGESNTFISTPEFIIHPSAGTEICAGDTLQITWDSTGIAAVVDISFSIDSGASFVLIDSNVAVADTFYSWVIPSNIATANCIIVFRDGESGGVLDTSDYFVINEKPTADAGDGFEYCFGDSVIIGGSPSATNGVPPYTFTWDQSQLLANSNIPNPIAFGDETFTLEVLDSKGCKGSDIVEVQENPLPSVLFAVFDTVTSDDTEFTLTQGFPNGGDYSGTGVSGDVFDPAVAGVGSHLITYVYTNSNGCADSASRSLEVLSASPYEVSSISTTCGGQKICVPIVAREPVPGGMFGVDFTLEYDPLVLTPTNKATLGPVVPGPFGKVSLNISEPGKIYTTVYLDAPPAGTFLSGAGDIVCLEFDINLTILPGTVSSLTINDSLLEGSNGGAKRSVIPGSFTFDNDSILTGFLRYRNKNGQPLSYDPNNIDSLLITTISGVTDSCTDISVIGSTPDLAGNFNYNVNNGTSIKIHRDINGDVNVLSQDCEDVMAVINSADRNRALNISNFKITNPSVYDLISADVNRDGIVNSFDVSLISSRTINANACEFPQSNYEFNGSIYVPKPSYTPSEDWIFINEVLIDDPLFTDGMSRHNVPQVPDCIPVTSTSNGNCSLIDDATYEAILLGDVNGNWKSIQGSNGLKTTEKEIVIDLLSADTLGVGSYSIPIVYTHPDVVTGIDLSMDYNEAEIQVNYVDKNPSVDLDYQWNDVGAQKLMITSYNAEGMKSGYPVLYLDLHSNQGQLNKTDLGQLKGYINGEKVKVRIRDGHVNGGEGEMLVDMYPNPAQNAVTLLVSQVEKTDVTITITDLIGQEIISITDFANYNYQKTINIESLSNGIYIIHVSADDQQVTKKLTKE